MREQWTNVPRTIRAIRSGVKTKRAAIQLEQFPIPIPEIFCDICLRLFAKNCIAHLRYKSGKTRWKNYGELPKSR
mgnify:CR=1 FL=1